MQHYYKFWSVLVHSWLMEADPAFLPVLLPRSQLPHAVRLRCLHSACVPTAGGEQNTHRAVRLRSGSETQLSGNTYCIVAGWQAGTVKGNRHINLHLREVNVGELWTRAEWGQRSTGVWLINFLPVFVSLILASKREMKWLKHAQTPYFVLKLLVFYCLFVFSHWRLRLRAIAGD